jgi:hypothetical protein
MSAIAPEVLEALMDDALRHARARRGAAGSSSSKDASTAVSAAGVRETAVQLRRTFALFDPRGTGTVPLAEVPLLLRAVGIDVSSAAGVAEQAQSVLPPALAEQVDATGRWPLAAFEAYVAATGAGMNSAQEAARVFAQLIHHGAQGSSAILGSTVGSMGGTLRSGAGVPPDSVLTLAGLKAALDEADARVTEAELKDVFRYCAFDADPRGLTQRDWLRAVNFVAEAGL